MSEITCSPLPSEEIPALKDSLMDAHLVAEDIEDGAARFFQFTHGHAICGYGGIELHGRDALIRSLVVLPVFRSNGIGKKCVDQLERLARSAGATQGFLATTTAKGFFERVGYRAIDRSEVPPRILATRQLSGLCPSTAPLMHKAL
ncbi:MAG: arsenic resistance N-acetyltransferase ArsN2 [Parvibaculaceae bacterium]|jgi:N-acetylglutamate synthase-like GNAT family acetyltransferase